MNKHINFMKIWFLLGILAVSLLLPGTALAQSEEPPALYGIGSTSKVVTAAAVLQLAEEGLVDLDAPLTRYIPEFSMVDPRYQNITPRMLLDHTSGLPGSTLTNSMLLGDPDTDNHDHLLERLRSQRLKAEPGAFGTYCNDGFTLAEILVEKVTGLTFSQYLETTFAKPLGLTAFTTPQSLTDFNRLAPVYDSTTGRRLPAEFPNVIGSGGIYANAADLCRFSQIFMNDQGQAKGLLSLEQARSMEESSFLAQVDGEGKDTILSYGLGWDSVDTYPFSNLGVRAVAKGGDTSYYHASLTVLPEENISCAILTSGGSSSLAQMAAQEILLTYLEETGRVPAQGAPSLPVDPGLDAASKDTPPASSMPEELASYSGYYAGRDIYQVQIQENGALTLSALSTPAAVTQTYLYRPSDSTVNADQKNTSDADGYFIGSRGQYIDISGSLVSSANGQLGQTRLTFITGVNGEPCLAAQISEIYPALGQTAMYLPLAQKITPQDVSPSVLSAWQERDGREYYLVSEKYSSTAYFNQFLMDLKVLSEPAGYLASPRAKHSAAILTDETHARFFQQIPGQVGRDLHDYRILQENGHEYLDTGDFLYVSEQALTALPAEDSVITIGEEAKTRWYTCGSEFAGKRIAIEIQGEGSFFVYEHSPQNSSCILSSYSIAPGQDFSLPAEGRLAFAGASKTSFTISVKE